ncbi:transcriptional regulator GcvA [Sulfurisoma sediminicola]|uniref:LysR family glycine cleavage system transcriptional activator n=1 Tax=Sulfurisoma sediminicola TaxID=1381557 RepID=A0A497X8S0_9PROT|nr:transcriptional regulator GcvA [Sulfurisoma sediminicola]RLJ62090.1 LysR family glycine cleavage system transcriptional activator [Sulfurisoma sediminicola]
MTYRLPPLNALRAFEVAARHLSFKNAAQELSVTPTAISHQIRMLEDFLGLALFRRLTRSLELTPEGEAMLPKVREGLECFAAAVESARVQVAQERLIVVAPPSFATRWLVPRLKGFSQAAPGVELHLVSSLNAIDGEQPGAARIFDSIDLREEESQVAICFGTGDYAGLHVDRILSSGYFAVCSPRLMEGPHPLREPADIRFHALIHDDTIANERARPSWEEWLRLAGVTGVDASAGPHFRDSGLALVAAIDGMGIALASRPLAATEVAAGRLVSPFKISVQHNYAYYLVTPEAISARPAVEAFRRWLLAEASAMEEFCRSHC